MDALAISLEIGGTKLQAALGTHDGQILATERGTARAAEGAQALLEWFGEPVPRLIAQAQAQGCTVSGIGVGFGGPIDTETGTILVSHQVSGWNGFALKQWAETKFGLPAAIINDSNASGWAEFCCGAGKGCRNFCYMNIGSGIGGALIIDGKLHDGQGRGAGEIGHTYVPDWTVPEPGKANKIENLCSGWSIERRMRATAHLEPGLPLNQLTAGDPQRITCAMLGEAARQGDPIALAELDHVGESVGIALSNVLTLFHPERIALGGGVSLLGDVLLEPIRRHTAARVFGPFRDRYEILPCALAESVVLVGGLLLAPR